MRWEEYLSTWQQRVDPRTGEIWYCFADSDSDSGISAISRAQSEDSQLKLRSNSGPNPDDSRIQGLHLDPHLASADRSISTCVLQDRSSDEQEGRAGGRDQHRNAYADLDAVTGQRCQWTATSVLHCFSGLFKRYTRGCFILTRLR